MLVEEAVDCGGGARAGPAAGTEIGSFRTGGAAAVKSSGRVVAPGGGLAAGAAAEAMLPFELLRLTSAPTALPNCTLRRELFLSATPSDDVAGGAIAQWSRGEEIR